MTPRSRRPGGGSSPSTHRPSRPDSTDTNSPPARRPDSGGTGSSGHVEINPDNLDMMATRLSNTGGRVDAVGTTLSGINVGPQSMGIVGGSFTGAAQSHVRAAQQHVTRTREAVQHAQDGTRGTAQAYREQEATNAAALRSIDTTTTPPNPRGSTTGGTTPSSATTPSGTPTPLTAGSSSTSPSSGTGSSPGGGSPPPGGPPGSTPAPGGGTPAAPIRNPFKRLARAHFDDADYATFDRAMNKMSEDPRSASDIAGSGALTPHEQAKIAEARKLVDIQPDTPMSKVIPESDWPAYMSGGYDSIGGFQARAADTTHLGNYAHLRDGLRLDYSWTDSSGRTVVSFPPGGSAYVIEYPAGDPSRYQVPFGSAYEPNVGQTATDAPIVAARDDMANAGTGAGYAPGQIDVDIRTWPNTGTGVTGHGDLGVPEFTTPDRMPIPDGAPAYRVDATGRHFVGYYDAGAKTFVPGPPPGGTP